jgi:putative peptide zinc metalloprotease protein
MSGPFFSQLWFRVARRTPVLAHHLKAHRHRYRGGSWYVLEDTVTGKVHRLSPAAYVFAQRLDGRRTVEQAWMELVELQGEDAPTQDDIIQLLGQLHSSDLLRGDVSPNAGELDDRHRKQSRAYLRQSLMNPTSLRIPLINPDGFLTATAPLVRPLFGWFGLVLFLALTTYAGLLAAEHWGELTENVSDRVLAADNLIMLACIYPVVKAIHELGHGYATKIHGGHVPEMGVMLLVLFPVPYVDASAAAAFREKRHRVLVGAAGILAEVLLAAIAMIIWARIEPGFERAVLFNVMVIGGVSTLLVNGNPLLKFDGYYIFADLIEIPNLQQRAARYLQHLVDAYAFGATVTQPVMATVGERIIFLLYQPVAYVYRLVVLFGIALFVATQYFVVGVALAIWMMLQSLVWPALKGLKHVFASAKLQRHRGRAVGVTLGALAVVCGFLGFVPVPSTYVGQGVVWLPDNAFVRAGTEGFVDRLAVRSGQGVRAGEQVASFADPTREAKLRMVQWRVRELELKLASATLDPFLAQTTKVELDNAREEMAREMERARRSVAKAPSGGTIVLANLDQDMPGRYYAEGDAVGYVLPARAFEIRAVAPAYMATQFRDRLRGAELRLPGFGTRATTVIREVPQAGFALPSAALSTTMGGTIATDPRDPENLTALARFLTFDLAVPEDLDGLPFGRRIQIKYRFAPEPLGVQVFRYARRVILRDFDA